MALTLKDVHYVAALARLKLSPEQEQLYQLQLSNILEVMEQLKAVDTEGVEATSHANVVASPLRPDDVRPSLPVDKGLLNAPAKVGTSFAVPRIIE